MNRNLKLFSVIFEKNGKILGSFTDNFIFYFRSHNLTFSLVPNINQEI